MDDLKVKIIAGTNKIGGCMTEISTSNTKILIDFGEDLPEDDKPNIVGNPNIDGLTIGEPLYDAVFITHSHGDHIGLIPYILDEIPVYVEKESQKLYRTMNIFLHKELRLNLSDMYFEKTININGLKITPYIVDHSAYNSAMLLIEHNNKKVLHTGDYRNHGRKGKIFDKILKQIGHVDLLITEGTTLSREDIYAESEKEEKLEIRSKDILNKYNQIFILQASTNIDRITTFYKAVKHNKLFIEDLFTANIVKSIDASVPKTSFGNIKMYLPIKYRNKSEKFTKRFITPFNSVTITKENLLNKDFAMMVKTSMIGDIEEIIEVLKENKNKVNACLVYSMWTGYKDKPSYKAFEQKLNKLGIKEIYLHTSGHADYDAMKRMQELTSSDKQIIIHTTNKEEASKIFPNIIDINDNEEIVV